MSKLDMIMEAFDIKEGINDKSEKISDKKVEEKAEKMSDVAEFVTEVELEKTDSNTTEVIGGDE